MRRHLVRARRSWIMAVALLFAVSTTGTQARISGCFITVMLANYDRHVFGEVTAECSGDPQDCFPWLEHSVPYGNWGVDSLFVERYDGDQFTGWKDLDDWRQWNSCTTEYAPPDDEHFNHANDTEQFTTEIGQIYDGTIAFLPNTSCSILDNYPLTIEEHWEAVYELDWCDEDEKVADILYPEQNNTMSCSGSGSGASCSPTSSDLEAPLTVSPDVLTALVRTIVWASWGSW